MRKLTLGAFAVAAGFVAAPVLAQTSGQSSSPMPGMSMSTPSQPSQQQSGGMCGCCQRMAITPPQSQQPPQTPRRQ